MNLYIFNKIFKEMSYTFETLYGIGVKNKIKEWNIKVIDKGNFSTMLYSYGYLNKSKVECSRNIYIDKNKKNTSHYQLAILYAQQKWKDKIEKDYNIDIEVVKIKMNTTAKEAKIKEAKIKEAKIKEAKIKEAKVKEAKLPITLQKKEKAKEAKVKEIL